MAATTERVLNYLLVEDNDDHADFVERCFRYGKLSGQIHRTHCGVDCLAYLDAERPSLDREQEPYPDVVLMDIRMAGALDGLHTLLAIRADPRHRSLPIIMLTSSDREKDVHRAYELGADGYIVKSFDTDEMTERLRQVQPPFTLIGTTPIANSGTQAENH